MSYPIAAVRNRPNTVRYLYDDFNGAAPSSGWTALLGTLATNSGALRASALAEDGYEIAANGTMEADANWASLNAPTTNERSNTQAHGGTYSRHVVCNVAGANEQGISQSLASIIGATFSFGGWVYLVSGTYAYILLGTTATTIVTTAGSWQQRASTRVATANPNTLAGVATKNAEVYFDDITCQLALAVLTYNSGTPNVMVMASMISPAALTTPRSLYLRGTDALNYVCLRLAPNTAGTDTILETVTAGVRATVAGGTADVGWTAGGTDKVCVIVRGNTYTVDYMKSGASVWTRAFTATEASFNTATLFGPMVWAVADNSWADVLIRGI